MLVTDRAATPRPLADVVRAAVAGGVSAVMLREKDLATADLVRLGREVRDVCRDAGVTFIVNHDVAAALRLSADGVHLGYRSVAVGDARTMLGAGALVGRSTHDRFELQEAQAAGADYVTFGPIRDTPSKRGLVPTRGFSGLTIAARSAGSMPVVALGGLTAADAGRVRGCGAAGVAAIRALVADGDPASAARLFVAAWNRGA